VGWQREMHAGIAGAIKDARRDCRFTANALADETGLLGFPVSRQTLANYESGRTQRLDVLDLLVLSRALGVPGLSLLFGSANPNAPVRMLPQESPISAAQAKQQFVGDAGLLWPGNEIAALREHLSLMTAAMGGTGALAAAAWSMSPNEIRQQQHRRPTPASPPEPPPLAAVQPSPKPQVDVNEIKRQEAELRRRNELKREQEERELNQPQVRNLAQRAENVALQRGRTR
jgi:transcriptional regulator with XRE-family HTH domain